MISKPTLGSNVAQNKTFSEWIVELFFDLCASYATGSKDDRPSALTPPAFGAGRELQIAVFRHHQLCVSARTFCLGYTAPVWRWIRLKSTVENGCCYRSYRSWMWTPPWRFTLFRSSAWGRRITGFTSLTVKLISTVFGLRALGWIPGRVLCCIQFNCWIDANGHPRMLC